MRPMLVDFRDDGKVDIDRAVYALPEIQELIKDFGNRHYVEVLVRLYMYRTPINPYAPAAEREARAIEDTNRFNKDAKVHSVVFKSGLWRKAVDRFNLEKYDPIFDSFIGLEQKIDEFNQAIAATPVSEMVEVESPKRGQKQKLVGRGKKSIVEQVFTELATEEEPEKITKRVDNTEIIQRMVRASSDVEKRYEEQREKLLRTKSSKGGSAQRAADFRRNLNPNG